METPIGSKGMSMKSQALALVSTAFLLFTPSSHGLFGGGGGIAGALETTQYANMGLLMDQYNQMVQQVRTTMDALNIQKIQRDMQIKQLLGGDNASILRQRTALASEIESLTGALRAYQSLFGSTSQARAVIVRRLDEAKTAGMSWEKYAARESDWIAMNFQGAADRVERERTAFQQVNADFQFAQDMATKIPETEGTHEATRSVAAIGNRLVAQNARLLALMNTEFGTRAADRESREAGDAARRANTLGAIHQQQQANRSATDAFRAGMDAYIKGPTSAPSGASSR